MPVPLPLPMPIHLAQATGDRRRHGKRTSDFLPFVNLVEQTTATPNGGPFAQCCCNSGTACIRALCCSAPVSGITIQIYDHPGGTLLKTCTTDASGICCVSLSTGFYWVVPSGAGPCIWSPTRAFINSNGTTAIGGQPDTATYVGCCGSCAMPKTMTLTDANGSYNFVWEPGPAFWFCTTNSANVPTASLTLVGPTCTFSGPSSGPTIVNYFGYCAGPASSVFNVFRVWGEVSTGIQFVPPGLCVGTPPWYYESSTIQCSRCSFAGSSGDLETGSSSWSATRTGCFSWSNTLVQRAGNLADPVGGTVTITG